MFFKHLSVYKIKGIKDFTQVSDAMEKFPFRPCKPMEEKTAGWVSPFGDRESRLQATTSGCLVICLKTEEKSVPASLINELLQEKLDELYANNPDIQKVKSAAKRLMKEEIKAQLLPRAFPKTKRTLAYLDLENHQLVIDSSSENQAKKLICLLRAGLGEELVALPIKAVHDVARSMSNWLTTGQNPAELTPGESCSLKDLESSGTIRYKKHEMDDKNLQDYLNENKTVVDLEVYWTPMAGKHNPVRFTLTESLIMKSADFREAFLDMEENAECREEAMIFQWGLMIDAAKIMIPYVLECLGGEHQDQ